MAKTTKNWRPRAEDLIRAVKDVAPADHPPAGAPGTDPHRKLFERYVKALLGAREQAEDWWEALVSTEEEAVGDRDEAVRNVKERRPVGPSVHGSVIAAVREYWLKCDALNRKTTPAGRVPPEEFVLRWLMDGPHDDLAEFLSGFPYWPIGLDRDDQWV